jgi:hypothetical protein
MFSSTLSQKKTHKWRLNDFFKLNGSFRCLDGSPYILSYWAHSCITVAFRMWQCCLNRKLQTLPRHYCFVHFPPWDATQLDVYRAVGSKPESGGMLLWNPNGFYLYGPHVIQSVPLTRSYYQGGRWILMLRPLTLFIFLADCSWVWFFAKRTFTCIFTRHIY